MQDNKNQTLEMWNRNAKYCKEELNLHTPMGFFFFVKNIDFIYIFIYIDIYIAEYFTKQKQDTKGQRQPKYVQQLYLKKKSYLL